MIERLSVQSPCYIVDVYCKLGATMDLKIRALRVFEQSLEVSPSETDQFLEDACAGDHELLAEVRLLLRTHQDSVSFLPESGDSRPVAANDLPFVLESSLAAGHVLLGRYRITSTVGSGGMGEVYRARDQHLDRDVAIKVLNRRSQGLVAMEERFHREIRSVAGLSHPNVMTLHDFCETDELSFAVMELVEGKTLRQLINEGLSWQESARIAQGIAEGLAAAHAKNLMHRDIKPENVMVSDNGIIKVLDFGLARPVAPDANQLLTASASHTPGTAPYMSPEQAEGTELTCATDVFSFGTTLYEMLAGENPFRDSNVFTTMRRVVAAEVPPLEPGTIPTGIQELVVSMLQGKAEHRPSATDVSRLLKESLTANAGESNADAIAGASPRTADTNRLVSDTKLEFTTSGPRAQPSTKPSIAILPFRLFGVAGTHAGIADALPHDLIAELSRMHWLHVISRGSSFQFRDADPNIVEIGKSLSVRYCLSGLVEILGDRISVVVEVSDTSNARVVWSDQFRSDVEGVHEIREKISSSVVAAMEVRIPVNEAHLARLKPAENLDAWGAFHLGLQHMYRFNKDDNGKAAEFFKRSIELEPAHSRAHAGLSSTEYYNARTHYTNDHAACVRRCREHAERSVEIDPLDPFSNFAMGRAFTAAGDREMSATWYERTLSIRPNFAQCLYQVALNNALTEQADASLDHIDQALKLSPLDPFLFAMHTVRAFAHIIREEYDLAAKWAEKVMATPNVHPGYACIPLISHTLNGDIERGSEWFQKIRSVYPDTTHAEFFASFPFQQGETKERITQAFLVHERSGSK